MPVKKNKKSVIIGISAGIAAYKILDLIKLFKKDSLEVVVILTCDAAKIVSPGEIENITGCKVYSQLFQENFNYKKVLKKREVEHIKIAQKASLILIAPATANIIGKIAAGIADDFLTTTLLAATCPVIICPSMNTVMWEQSIVQENLTKLKRRGYMVLPPKKGFLACGTTGVGKLIDIAEISASVRMVLKSAQRLEGKKILVTSGGTSENIDAVRILTNRSSGKMGVALAQMCQMQGAEVLLLRSSNSVCANGLIKEEIFTNCEELFKLIKIHVSNYDVLFHSAAVSDFIPRVQEVGKLESEHEYNLALVPGVKIIDQIKKINPGIKLVGFKAVVNKTLQAIDRIAEEKIKKSGADYLIVNDVGKKGIGFGSDENEVYIYSTAGFVSKVSRTSKHEVARQIIEIVL